MNTGTLSFVLSLLLFMVSCAATGSSHTDISGRIPPIPEGEGRVYFYRIHASFEGSAGSPDVELDEEVVGELPSGGFFFVDVAPGSHAIRLDAGFLRGVNKGVVTVAPGERVYVEFRNRNGELRVADGFQAELDITTCVYTGDESALLASGQ